MFGKNVLRSSGLLPKSFCGRVRGPHAPSLLLGDVSHWRWCPLPALPLAFGALCAGHGPRLLLLAHPSSASDWLCPSEPPNVPQGLGFLICKVGMTFLPSLGSMGSSEPWGFQKSEQLSPPEGQRISPGGTRHFGIRGIVQCLQIQDT